MDTIKEIKERIAYDVKKCTNCKKCYTKCPMMRKFGSNPKEIMNKLLNDEINPTDIAYSCMLCDLCVEKCSKNIDFKTIFFDLRKEIIKNNNRNVKNKNYSIIKFHQMNSFSPVFSKSSNLENSNVLFLPGCSLSSYDKNIVLRSYEYLKLYYKNISITFNCCGKPTLSMGDTYKFKSYYSKLEEIIYKNSIEELVVACPNCYSTISKYNRNIKVTSIYEIISKYGIPTYLINNYKNIDIAIHDSCSVRKEVDIQNSVREILRSLGINIIEFKNNKENTVCCGAGGMVGVTNKELALEQMQNRGYETNCNNIVCYCESCCESLLNTDKNVLHILDLLFNETVVNNKVLTQTKTGTISKWRMRYKSLRIAKK